MTPKTLVLLVLGIAGAIYVRNKYIRLQAQTALPGAGYGTLPNVGPQNADLLQRGRNTPNMVADQPTTAYDAADVVPILDSYDPFAGL